MLPIKIIDDIKGHITSGVYNFDVLYTLRQLMGFEDEIISLVGHDDLLTIDVVTSELGFKEYPNVAGKHSLSAETIAERNYSMSIYMNECKIMDLFIKIVAANELATKQI